MVTTRITRWAAVLAVILLPEVTNAATLLEQRVTDRTLANGMKVLLVERHGVPTVSYNVTFRVGSVNEDRGQSGLAHFFEHMAFKGTRTIGTKDYQHEQSLLDELDRLAVEPQTEQDKGTTADPKRVAELRSRFQDVQDQARKLVVSNELGALYDRQGAVGFNATTGVDLTRYVVSLPANRFPLWLAIESDRIARPVFREFYTERDVVLEERRLRVDTNPMGQLYEAFFAAAFVAHPYRVPTIGWPSDVERLTTVAARRFFDQYYSPDNAVVAIVGDIDAQDVLRRLAASLGTIPVREEPPPVSTREPEQHGERRVDVEFDAQPQLLVGYHKPDLHHPDDAVFDVIEALLSSGRTSRLYTALVKSQQVAVAASASSGEPDARYPNLFVLQATPRAPHTLEEVEAALQAEISRLQREDVSARELKKVINGVDADLIRSLQSNSGLASRLAYFQAEAGDWRYLLRNRDQMAAVTPADIRRVASTWFIQANRTVARLVKPHPVPDAPRPQGPS